MILHSSPVYSSYSRDGITCYVLDLRARTRWNFDRSQDFLPREWEKNLTFIRVGKTNDSQTTTATTRRFVVLRSTTVLFWNSRDGGVVNWLFDPRSLLHSVRHFSECLKTQNPTLHFLRIPGKLIASHRALSINPHALHP